MHPLAILIAQVIGIGAQGCGAHRIVPVSYTHLDVYKRQMFGAGVQQRIDRHRPVEPAHRRAVLQLEQEFQRPVKHAHLVRQGHRRVPLHEAHACLLYTSRCV